MLDISVVVPFYNGELTLGTCLDALESQSLKRARYELILVDDGSTDGSAVIANRPGIRVVRQKNAGAPAARNAGIAVAAGNWVAFTDADCIPSRGWLRALLAAVEAASARGQVMGAAGSVAGHPSSAPASRCVDLCGGFDTAQHLDHPRFPFAPAGNVMYRRDALNAVGGFDERFASYDACDLHTRLRARVGGEFVFVKSALVLHRHRERWDEYWKQQKNYGKGLAQFYIHRSRDIPWSRVRELRAWIALAPAGMRACLPGDPDVVLARRGDFVKRLAQRIGFAKTYFRAGERTRWLNSEAT